MRRRAQNEKRYSTGHNIDDQNCMEYVSIPVLAEFWQWWIEFVLVLMLDEKKKKTWGDWAVTPEE